MSEKKLLAAYRKARENFWEVHDKLTAQGLTLEEKDENKQYQEANQAVSEAYQKWLKEE